MNHQEEQDEPNNRDEPPQESEVSPVLYTSGWYICSALMVTVHFSRGRLESKHKCMVGARLRTGSLCSWWSVHLQEDFQAETTPPTLRSAHVDFESKCQEGKPTVSVWQYQYSECNILPIRVLVLLIRAGVWEVFFGKIKKNYVCFFYQSSQKIL